MSPNERVIILQRQVELMQARMERIKEQRDVIMDTLLDVFNSLEDHVPASVANPFYDRIKLLRESLGQDEIL